MILSRTQKASIYELLYLNREELEPMLIGDLKDHINEKLEFDCDTSQIRYYRDPLVENGWAPCLTVAPTPEPESEQLTELRDALIDTRGQLDSTLRRIESLVGRVHLLETAAKKVNAPVEKLELASEPA
jgi:hypothetical protein